MLHLTVSLHKTINTQQVFNFTKTVVMETKYIEYLTFYVVFLSLTKCRYNTLNKATTDSVLTLPNYLYNNHPTIRCYIILATGNK
jgi:hypothetical protein